MLAVGINKTFFPLVSLFIKSLNISFTPVKYEHKNSFFIFLTSPLLLKLLLKEICEINIKVNKQKIFSIDFFI